MPVIEISTVLDSLLPAPVAIPLPAGASLPAGPLQLKEEGGSRVMPAQRDGDGVVALVSGLKAGDRRRYRLEGGAAPGGVTLKEEGPHALAIALPEGPFTTYHFNPAVARPFFHPVAGPGGKRVTRDFPMKDVAEEKEAKDQDHPHHRSFWTAYDEVNGTDNWSEGPNHGWTRHQKFTSRAEGPVWGGFAAEGVWTSKEGNPVVDERRSIRVYNVGPERRLLDYDVHLIASHGDVEYGDTKEGGILAFRVFHTIKGKEGGRMENSNGSVGEAQCWGKRAAWLDYNGPVGGEVLGIAMMDHPGNPNHPCRWHARDYGLVGTNPFATAAFEKGAAETPYRQKKGETLRFRYRVLIHRGTAREGRVDEIYHQWIQAPTARVVG
jgi:hypothetical protein